MNYPFKASAVALCALLTSACNATNPSNEHTQTKSNLRVVTWNIEHLAADNTAGCRPRTEKELAELQSYAKSLNADVIAFQEVGSVKALETVLDPQKWQLIISNRADSPSYTCRGNGLTSTQQKVAFAVKKNLPVEKVVQHKQFSDLKMGLRSALEVQLNYHGETLSLLNVHLKSGCFVDDYRRSDKDSCKLLAKQVPLLDKWVEDKSNAKAPFIVLGDFNHRLSAPYNRFSRDLNHPDGLADKAPNDVTKSTLFNANLMLTGCHPYYPAPIDHVLVSKTLKSDYVQNSAQFHYFDNMEPKKMLSDHCALSIDLK
ncbi:endonuclease/exonuclease/phosphatase family protein [Pseudoalteromonas luteoviolacea]|uniref:endonuclease/exonuclease/phosphatase family protein n=1 Tax=Pseudoalteromonas luteoviolacea TaxID=43657 RepID=UPI001B365545|nr:endonuclease/exonuclease/phosphatase family protein [Pseudoalteromonas luteoviolacea]MBQ4810093.1 endonuclease/exonuclease/phosphatase family protein [Pseudoalteromonas luteoviolacea]